MTKAKQGATPGLSTNSLSYSIKVSFVLAFSESELWRVIGGTDDIVKEIPHQVRTHRRKDVKPPSIWASTELAQFAALGSADQPGRQYNSWGITRDLPHSTSPQHPKGRRTLWPYTTEPQKILARKITLSGQGLQFRIRNHKAHSSSVVNHHTDWLLAVDSSVSGFQSSDIVSCIPGAGSNANWDSFGLRILSPIYTTGIKNQEQEICQMLRAVSSEDTTTAAFATNHCGLHVQVDCPNGINFLQALATLLLIYETQISRLNNPWRHPSHIAAKGTIESNRLGLIAKDRLPRSETEVNSQEVSCDDANFKQRLTINEIRERVAAQTDPQKLVRMLNWPPSKSYGHELGNRNRQVDFTTAVRSDGSRRYIDFRSAQSSLCEKHVSRWVDFCVRLVRLATFYAENPEQFPVQHWDEVQLTSEGELTDCLDVFALLNLMGMDSKAIDYWEHKAASYMVGKVPQCDCEDTAGCKRLQGRKRRYSGTGINDLSPVSQRRKLNDAAGPKIASSATVRRRRSNDDSGSDITKLRQPLLISFVVPNRKGASSEIPKAVPSAVLLPVQPPVSPGRQNTAELQLDHQTAQALANRLGGTPFSPPDRWRVTFVEDNEQNHAHEYAARGVLSSANSLMRDDFTWRILDFKFSHWAIVRTRSTLQVGGRIRRNICGVFAIIESLRYQYPDVPRPPVAELLRIGDELAKVAFNPQPELHNAEDELLEQVLRRWNGGTFVLVVVLADAKTVHARRVGHATRKGRDLYVYHTPPQDQLALGHWEGMRRKTKEELEALETRSAARKASRDARKNTE